jgi:hypothetical protein
VLPNVGVQPQPKAVGCNNGLDRIRVPRSRIRHRNAVQRRRAAALKVPLRIGPLPQASIRRVAVEGAPAIRGMGDELQMLVHKALNSHARFIGDNLVA